VTSMADSTKIWPTRPGEVRGLVLASQPKAVVLLAPYGIEMTWAKDA
jgi:hypothetical protein